MSKRILDHPILGKTEAHLKKLETLASNARSDRFYYQVEKYLKLKQSL